jgi:putative tryptophan/tyrosine transport system substrate-binding protein
MNGEAIQRRSFLTLLGGAAAAWPVAAGAQQSGRMRRIGVLMARAESDPIYQAQIQSFRARLQQLGWTDGDNLRFDYRWTAGVADRFRTAAAELVALKPDVILADATPSVAALRRETQTIPIVFVWVTDPVAQGFVVSLAQPGGHVTGFTNNEFSMGGKWLGLLKDAAPTITRIALMFNPTTAPYASSFLQVIEAAAPSRGMVSTRMPVQSAAEIEGSIAAFAREPNGSLLMLSDSFLTVHRDRILALSAGHRLPTINDALSWTKSGGLIAYGADGLDMHRGAASYVDRILRGAKPSDLPVQAPTKFVLSVNLKTAKAMGLSISESFLLAADEVIE